MKVKNLQKILADPLILSAQHTDFLLHLLRYSSSVSVNIWMNSLNVYLTESSVVRFWSSGSIVDLLHAQIRDGDITVGI